jgi:hypothetical protein
MVRQQRAGRDSDVDAMPLAVQRDGVGVGVEISGMCQRTWLVVQFNSIWSGHVEEE